MIVFMPKYSYYNALSYEAKTSVESIISNAFKEYLRGTPDVFIEDELAMLLIKEKQLKTCTSAREIPSMLNAKTYDEYTFTIADMHKHAESIALDYKGFAMPDIKIAYSDPDKYNKQYIEMYKDRVIDYIREYARKQKVAIIFKGNKQAKNFLVPESIENDAILYITVSLETGQISGSYSGMWVDRNMIKKIIGGIYGE